MPKCIELLPCDWLISNLSYQAIEHGPVFRKESGNSEYVNPEMRETLGFPFQNGRVCQTLESRVSQAHF